MSLSDRKEVWEGCTACPLGVSRTDRNKKLVYGEGVRNGIMFIGESPGAEEEQRGCPFSGRTGQLLRKVISYFGLVEHYLTQVVICRSCEPIMLDNNEPMKRQNFKTRELELVMKDVEPSPVSAEACLARLYEQIYLVDPVVIVSLGAPATKFLQGGKSCNIMAERGEERTITIPGRIFEAKKTPKGAWARQHKNVIELPMVPNELQYLLIPTLSPTLVARKHADMGADAPSRLFAKDIQKACRIFERYQLERGVQLEHTFDIDATDVDFQATAEEEQEGY